MKKENIITTIGKKVKHYRTQQNISLSALAKAAKISKSTLFSLELGETNPTIATLEAIADALNIDIATLISNPNQNGLMLLDTPSETSTQLYQLKLTPLESYTFAFDLVTSLAITITSGSATLLQQDIHLKSGQSANLSSNTTIVAGSQGATVHIETKEDKSPILLANDILNIQDNSIDLKEFTRKILSQKIIRIIGNSNLKVKTKTKIPYIHTTKKEYLSSKIYYIFTRYIGYKHQIQKNLQFFNNSEESNTLLELIEYAIIGNTISNNYISKLNDNPLESYLDSIEKKLIKDYPNLTFIEPEEVIFKCNKKGTIYLYIGELLSASQTPLKKTLTRNLYRALEQMFTLEESIPKELDKKLNALLPEALYYATNGYSDLALSVAKNLYNSLNNIIECSTKDKTVKYFYCKIVENLKKAIDMYSYKESYFSKNDFEQILNDCGAKIYINTLLFPAQSSSGKYIYLFEF